MPAQQYEAQIARLEERAKAMEARIAEIKDDSEKDLVKVHAKLTALEDERNKALKWGVMSLGSAVMGMAYWIFNAVTGGHIK